MAIAFYSMRVDAEGTTAGRSDANVIAHTALVIDVDRVELGSLDGLHGDGLLTAIDASGWACYVYTSPSDTPDDPAARRVRVISPITREIKPSEIKAARKRYAEALGIGPGQGVETAEADSQCFFIGRIIEHPEPRESWTWLGEGTEPKAVDVDALLARPLVHKWPDGKASAKAAAHPGLGRTTGTVEVLAPTVELAEGSRAARLLAALAPKWQAPAEPVQGGRRQLLRGLGGYLARWGWTDAEITAVAAGLPTARPLAERADLMLEAAAQRRSNTDAAAQTAGWQSICAWDPSAAKAIEKLAGSSFAPPTVTRGQAVAVRSQGPTRAAEIILPELAALDLGERGAIRPSRVNARRVVQWLFGPTLRYDECSDRMLLDETAPEPDGGQGHPDGATAAAYAERIRQDYPALASAIGSPWCDHHTTVVAMICESFDMQIATSTLHEVISSYAHDHAFNAISEFALRCAQAWDRTPRVDGMLADYFQVAPGPVVAGASVTTDRVISRVWMLSLAARALDPGCQCDTALVLQGDEGHRKTSAIRALAGPVWSAEGALRTDDIAAAQGLRGKWVWEISEGFGPRTWDSIKAFLTTRKDTYRAPYARNVSDVPRQTVFAVTVNDERFVSDPRGARRFLIVTVQRQIDTSAIERDRVQLIGEAVTRVIEGEPWWPSDAEATALVSSRENYGAERDPWCDAVSAWAERRGLKAKPNETDPRVELRAAEVFDEMRGALPMPAVAIGRREYMRLADVLRSLGYRRVHDRGGWKYERAAPA